MENEITVTKQTEEKIKRWYQAQNTLLRAKENLNTAEIEFASAINDLGAFLTPKDAFPNESFNIWFGDSLLNVTKIKNDYKISWRTKGKSAVL